MEMFVMLDGQQQGPFSVLQIQELFRRGRVNGATMAWRAGMPDWQPLAEFPEFAGLKRPTSLPKPAVIYSIAAAALVLIVVLVVAILQPRDVKVSAEATESNGASKPATTAKLPKSNGPDTVEHPGAKGPETLEEINRAYAKPPAGQNAATAFLRAIEALQITDADKKSALPIHGATKLPAPGEPLTISMRSALNAWVKRNEAAWPTFFEAGRFNESRYPIDLRRGPETLLPHLAPIRKGAQALELLAVARSIEGKPAETVRAIESIFALGRSLQFEPLLISQLVRFAVEGIAISATEQALNRTALPLESLERLQAALNRSLESATNSTAISDALVCDRVSTLSFLNSDEKLTKLLLGGGQISKGPELDALVAEVKKNLKADRAFFIESIDRALEARKKPFPERLKVDEILKSRAKEAAAKHFVISKSFLPVGGAAKEAGEHARLALAQIAFALERFRADGASYPEKLEQLSPKHLASIPLDPFDGRSFEYAKRGSGYALTSAGQQGGTNQPPKFAVIIPPKP